MLLALSRGRLPNASSHVRHEDLLLSILSSTQFYRLLGNSLTTLGRNHETSFEMQRYRHSILAKVSSRSMNARSTEPETEL